VTARVVLRCLLVVAAILAVPLARTAHATCPPPAPAQTGEPFLVAPADGAEAPSNGVVLIHWPDPPSFCESNGGPCPTNQHRVLLRDAGGQLVPTSVSSFFWFGPEPRQTRQINLVPQADLVPAQIYRVLWGKPDGTEVLLGSFSAGAPIADGPPAPPVITGVTVGPLHECGADDFGCCTSTMVRRVTLAIAPTAQPDTYATASFDRGTFDQLEITGLFYCDERPTFDFLAGPGKTVPFTMAGGAHEIGVTARAATGWVSEPTTVVVYGSCDPAAPDAGPVNFPDAAAPDASSDDPDPDGGCQIGAPGRAPPRRAALAGILIALLLVVRTRRAALALAGLATVGCGNDGGVRLAAPPACQVPKAPHLLASLASCPYALAVDDTHLYWLDSHLARFPKCGSSSPPEALAPFSTGSDLVVDEQAVYYLAGEKLMRVAKDGSPPTALLTIPSQDSRQLAIDDDAVYVATDVVCIVGEPCGDERALLWRAAKDGSSAEPILRAGGFQLFDVAVDGSHAYFSGNVQGLAGQLGRVPKRGGTPEAIELAGLVGSPTTLAVAGDTLFFAASAQLFARSTSGGGEATIASEAYDVQDLAADDDHVYWTVSDLRNGGQVRRAPRAGGVPETLADATDPREIVVDRGAIYFTTCAQGFSAGVWIMAR
jgi:hypothetical protein